MHTSEKKSRTLRYAAIWIAAFLVVGCILVAGKANAQCVAGSSDTTCPTPSKFIKKWHAGYFHHAHGIPVKRVLKTPRRDRAKFIKKYEHLYANASTKKQHALYDHAVYLAGKNKTSRTTTCFFPLTPYCQASLEWTELIAGTKCGFWHSGPNLTSVFTCDRFEYNGQGTPCIEGGSCGKPLTWTQFRNGVKLVACAVGTGASIVMAVGSEGSAAAPALGAASAGTACAVAAFESVSK